MASTSTVDPLSAMVESPNWLEMPHEVMANILERLGDAEILNSAVKVCTTWERICKDPSMWKAINVHKPVWPARDAEYDLEALTKQAVHLSSGELIDISISGFGNDELLHYIVLRSSKLNSLCLTNCYGITSNGLSRALKTVPQLETLDISYTHWQEECIKVNVPNCPQLKSFKLDRPCSHLGIKYDYDGFTIANNMPELRKLQVFGYKMTNDGLQAILDGRPHLESLEVRTCYNINIDENEVKLSMGRIKNFKFKICGTHSLVREYFLDSDYEYDDDFSDYDYDYDDDSDYDYPDYLYDDIL